MMRSNPGFLWSLVRRLWGWFIAVPMTLYGVFALIRDEFLPSPLRDQLRIGGLLGQLQWEYWLISGLSLLVLVAYAPKLQGLARSLLQRPPTVHPLSTLNIDGLRIAHGYSVSFPAERTQEYSLTVVNESGADLTDCRVTLDRSEYRIKEDAQWQLEHVDLLDAPFRWNRSNVTTNGRIAIEAGERASFTFGRSTWYPVMDAKTKETSGLYQFILALFDFSQQKGEFELIVGYSYRLQIAIRAKDRNSSSLPKVRYELRLKPTASSGPAGGLEVYEIRRST